MGLVFVSIHQFDSWFLSVTLLDHYCLRKSWQKKNKRKEFSQEEKDEEREGEKIKKERKRRRGREG